MDNKEASKQKTSHLSLHRRTSGEAPKVYARKEPEIPPSAKEPREKDFLC